MLDMKFIRENPDVVKDAGRRKKIDVDVDRLIAIDEKRRALISETDRLKAERNSLSKDIPSLQGDEREKSVARVKQIKSDIATGEAELERVKSEFDGLMARVPNIVAPDVPDGQSDDDNVLLRKWGEPKRFDFTPRDHVEIAEMCDLLDTTRAAKFAGARTYFLKNEAVILHMAVLRLAMDMLVKKGFTPMLPPVIVKDEAMFGTGFFPAAEEQTYRLERDNLNLAGTSEVPLVCCHANEILDEAALPLYYAGISPCFRREAGTYGKDTRGLYRVHQFEKIEQVVFCQNDLEQSERAHARLLANSEEILQALELPYRIMAVCAVEMGQPKYRQHDVETWMPSRNAYSETHSCSTLLEFQARRSNIRYRNAAGENVFCHTLNNTMIASPRILIPLLEVHQNGDGSVTVPAALRPYTNGLEKIAPNK